MRRRSLLFAVLFILPFTAQAQIDIAAKQAIAVDYNTGAVLFAKNADQRMPTSSMSKTMSMYMVFQAIRDGRLKMDQTLPVSRGAWAQTIKSGESRMFLDPGANVKVSDLVRGVVIQSGNDAAIVLAEGVSGSEAAFAQSMNAQAQKWGLANTNFMDASGMPDPNHYSTARDLATINVHLIRDFPEYYPIFAEKSFMYNRIKQGNRNPLLYRDIGADGVKTGHTEAGGYGLIGSGARQGRRVVIVLNGMRSMQARADEGAKLLDWALRGFEDKMLFKAGETVDTVPVILGQAEKVALVADRDVEATLPNGQRNGLNVSETFNAPLRAPVRKGDRLGTLTVTAPNVGKTEYPLLAGENVGKLGFFSATFAKLKLKILGGPVDPTVGDKALPKTVTVH